MKCEKCNAQTFLELETIGELNEAIATQFGKNRYIVKDDKQEDSDIIKIEELSESQENIEANIITKKDKQIKLDKKSKFMQGENNNKKIEKNVKNENNEHSEKNTTEQKFQKAEKIHKNENSISLNNNSESRKEDHSIKFEKLEKNENNNKLDNFNKLTNYIKFDKPDNSDKIIQEIALSDSKNLSREIKNNFQEYCKEHSEEILNYFCIDCSYSLICSECVIHGIHKNHNVVTVRKAAPSILRRLDEMEEKIDDQIKKMEEISSQFPLQKDSIKDKIIKHIKEI